MTFRSLQFRQTLAAAICLFTCALAHARESNRNVLVLHTDSQLLAGVALFDEEFRARLNQESGESITVINEFLDIDRQPESYKTQLAELLRRKYRDVPIDAITVIRSPALLFWLNHQESFPPCPVIFAGVGKVELQKWKLPSNVLGVPILFQPGHMLEAALQLHPGTKRVVVITGETEQERLREKAIRAAFRSAEGRVQIDYWNRLQMREMSRSLSKLTPDTIIFTPGIMREGNSQSFTSTEFISRLSAESKCPIYAGYNTAIGKGAVGVYMAPIEEIAQQAADLAKYIVDGGDPRQLTLPDSLPNRYLFDWRQLHRFGIKESKLPPGSVIKFRNPTLWESHRWVIIAVVIICLLQAVLISALLFQLLRRRQAEYRFRAVVESVPNALVMVDTKGKIELINTRAERLFGYGREELRGFSIERLIPDWVHGMHPDRRRTLRNFETKPAISGRDLFCLHKNGEEILVEIGLNSVKTKGETFVLASIVDISERRKAEMEMERQKQQLMHLGRVEILSHFSGSLAHELNQPLTALFANLEVAKIMLEKRQVDTSELKGIIKDAVADNRRASDIVVRLRGWLKGEKQRFSVYDLNGLVEEATYFLRSELMFHKTTCTVDLDASNPMATCDKVQIQQVIVNLVKNSLEAFQSNSEQDNGKRQIVIRTSRGPEGKIIVSVSDNGEGILESVRNTIFHPFISTKKEGLGMGLSICESIIKSHGGRIWVDGARGEGTVFYFTLPAAERVEDRLEVLV